MPGKKLFIVVNVDWFFISHRLPIAMEAKRLGYEVTIFAIDTGKGDFIREQGLRFIPIPTSRAGMNIFKELNVLRFFYKIYKKEQPDIIHHVAVKPVTYGSIAAKWAGIKTVVNALSGLGFLFINAEKNKLAHRLVMSVFKYGFSNPNVRFILQNKDDLKMIKQLDVLDENQIFLIKGSGVSLEEFSYREELPADKIQVLLPARMLWDKGVGEFVEAARSLYPKYNEIAEFVLAGSVDMGNKAGISQEQLNKWDAEGCIRWVDFQKNMVATLEKSHIVVLPSYREGLPKSLIEACAIGRPIVTTNVPGCRETVDDGVNGFLVENKNPVELAQAIEKLILDKELRLKMGRAARKKAESDFSIENVIERTINIYEGKTKEKSFASSVKKMQ